MDRNEAQDHLNKALANAEENERIALELYGMDSEEAAACDGNGDDTAAETCAALGIDYKYSDNRCQALYDYWTVETARCEYELI